MYKQTTLLMLIVVFLSCAIEITRTATVTTWSQNIAEDLQLIKRKTKDALHWLVDEPDDSSNGASTGMRTFGAIRRLKIAIPAIMYKLGVMTTVLGFLTLFTLKGLLIGAVLLILQLSSALSKLHSAKQEHGDDHHKVPQNIHVHVHGGSTGPGHHYTYESHGDHGPYSGWSKSAALSPNKMDDDYYYKRYKEYKDLRDSLYSQVAARANY